MSLMNNRRVRIGMMRMVAAATLMACVLAVPCVAQEAATQPATTGPAAADQPATMASGDAVAGEEAATQPAGATKAVVVELATTGPAAEAATQPAETQPAETQPAAAELGVKRALTREEELYLLDTRQAQLARDQAEAEMNKAKVDLDQVQTLFDEKLETIDKLNAAEQAYEQGVLKHRQAQIELEKKRLEFLKNATLVTVVNATYHREGSEVMASITLRNDSDLAKARIAMEGGGEMAEDRLASLLKVDNVIVTISGESASTDEAAAIVGDPFQRIVRELSYGEEVTLSFRLLKKDVESVKVSLDFLGQVKEYKVFLKMESDQDLPTISSTQYSQLGALGSKILYDLELDRLAKSEQSFPLVVLNMPQEIPVAFLDASSKARLTQVKFTEEISKQSLYLEVSIPEKLGQEMVGSSISFYIVVAQRQELKAIADLKRQYAGAIPAEEIAKLKGNKVELVLIPEGVGKLEILVGNLFKEVQQGQDVEVKFNILNSGTLALRRVTPELDLPLEWEGGLEPLETEVVQGGEKTMFTMALKPPSDVAVGEYTVRIKASGHSGMEIVEAIDKDLTVRIVAKSNVTGTAVLVGSLVVLVLGIAVASIKISRR